MYYKAFAIFMKNMDVVTFTYELLNRQTDGRLCVKLLRLPWCKPIHIYILYVNGSWQRSGGWQRFHTHTCHGVCKRQAVGGRKFNRFCRNVTTQTCVSVFASETHFWAFLIGVWVVLFFFIYVKREIFVCTESFTYKWLNTSVG